MQTEVTNTTGYSKIPNNGEGSGKTKIQLQQTINNLTWQNTDGRFTERIEAYRKELEEKSKMICHVTHEVVKLNHDAVMAFNAMPKNFKY